VRTLGALAIAVGIAAFTGVAACNSSTGAASPAAAKSASAAALPTTQTATRSASGQVAVAHARVQAGVVTLTFKSEITNPQYKFDMQLFALHSGVTLAAFRQELPSVFSISNHKAAAVAVTWIIPRIVALGGNPGTQTTQIQAVLPAGTYYVGDLSAWAKSGGKSGLASFQVAGSASGAALPAASQSISMVEQAANMPRFSVQPATLKQGWTLIHNDSSAPHQAFMVPIKQGTTVQEVITSLNGVSTFTGIPVGVDMISPHSSINWMLQAPPGHYAVVCLVPDPATGKPQYQMGMVTLVTVAAGPAGG
jgi:hypothetical protein